MAEEMRRRLFGIVEIPVLFTASVTIACLAGCSPSAAPNPPSPAATADTYRATPEADSPAAGICASFKEETVRIEIRAWPDGVPDPRCVEVRAEQKLLLVNSAPEPIEFTLGRFHEILSPGETFTAELAFGEYLMPGAHSLHIAPYGGPEIFFVSANEM